MAGLHYLVGRRAFLNFILPAAAFASAPFNAKARQAALTALKRYANVADDAQTLPMEENQSILIADLILDALDRDADLRAEIVEWLVSEYPTECLAVVAVAPKA
jgi:hypothetical protein